jgi:thioester reductase-like protein
MEHPDWRGRTVALTGATGFIGREILGRLLDSGVARVYVLVRGDDEATREKKITRALGAYLGQREIPGGLRQRVTIVAGDVSKPGLGLSVEDQKRLATEVTHLLHGAANVNFGVSPEDHFLQNHIGTRHVLELAHQWRERGVLEKLDYVGTAFIAGNREGLIREDELNCGQRFNNSYEESKFRAEAELLLHGGTLPITRFRPSIVLGDQTTGRTSNFKMLYWLVRVYEQGYWRTIPALKETVVDVVPVNFVADAILALSPRPESIGQAYHLAAGPLKCSRAAEIAELVQAFFRGKPVRFVHPGFYHTFIGPTTRLLSWGELHRILTRGRVYEPYFVNRKVFDTSNLERDLVGVPACPRVNTYFNNLFEFCLATDWGRKELPNGQS